MPGISSRCWERNFHQLKKTKKEQLPPVALTKNGKRSYVFQVVMTSMASKWEFQVLEFRMGLSNVHPPTGPSGIQIPPPCI